MTLSRSIIREFIAKVEWATATNICYLLTGKRRRRDYAIIAAELNSMCRTKRREIRLKKLQHDFYTPYALATSSRTSLNHRQVEHDIKLRNCLGKYLYICGAGLLEYLSLRTFADAVLTLPTGNLFFFEFDSGHMGKKQLIEKIKERYICKGAYRVVFFLGTAEYAHWKNIETIKCLERNRLDILFRIVRKVLKDKPNRVLGACYHEYLQNGKIYNHKGSLVWTEEGERSR